MDRGLVAGPAFARGVPTMTTDDRQRAYWEGEHAFRSYDHPVVRLFAEQRLAFLASLIELSRVRQALDIGCGDGFSTYYMRRRIGKIWGSDRSRAMLNRHPLREDGRLAVADARALPYADASFDLVYGWEILHHVADPVEVVSEMARVTREHVLLIEPNRNHPAQFAFALVDAEHRWVLKYSRGYLESMCTRAGLRLVKSATGGHIFPNKTPISLARLLMRLPYVTRFGISNWVLAAKP